MMLRLGAHRLFPRQIMAKVFLPLDKSKLPNLANTWPFVTKQLVAYTMGRL